MNARKREVSGQMLNWRSAAFATERLAEIGAETFVATLHEGDHDSGIRISFSEPRTVTLQLRSDWRPGEPSFIGTIDGRAVAMQVRPILNGVRIGHAGTQADARVFTRREAEFAAMMPKKEEAGRGTALLCPMPGLVKAISVRQGQEVKVGEALCIVEAMKMENVLRAERDAKVKTIRAKEGDTLAVDAVIMDFE